MNTADREPAHERRRIVEPGEPRGESADLRPTRQKSHLPAKTRYSSIPAGQSVPEFVLDERRWKGGKRGRWNISRFPLFELVKGLRGSIPSEGIVSKNRGYFVGTSEEKLRECGIREGRMRLFVEIKDSRFAN